MKRHDSDRRALLSAGAASLLIPGSAHAQNAPAAGAPFIGLFTDASRAAIPPQAITVQTAGHIAPGLGSARYIFDPTIDHAFVAANPRTAFVMPSGRGFRLTHDQEITPFMFGASGSQGFNADLSDFDDLPDDTAALQEFFQFCSTRRVESVNWGGVFGISAGLLMGNIDANTQESYENSTTYAGAIVLAVKSDITRAVLTCRNRRFSTYGPVHIVGVNKQSRNYTGRNFDIGLLIERVAHMQVFSAVHVSHARVLGIVNEGRFDTPPSQNNVYQNHIQNALLSLCGSGAGRSIAGPEAGLSAYSTGRSTQGANADRSQSHLLKVDLQPPAWAAAYALPVFVRFPAVPHEFYRLVGADAAGSTISVFPWINPNVPVQTPVEYVIGGGLLTLGGDAGMLSGKITANGCAMGVINSATYGTTLSATAQHNAIAYVQGSSPADASLGSSLNGYFEGNDCDIMWNAVEWPPNGYFTLMTEQALDLSKVILLNPRSSPSGDLIDRFKPHGLLLNFQGYWHHVEHTRDFEFTLQRANVGFNRPYSDVIPLHGDDPTIDIFSIGSAPYQRLFGYRARKVDITGSGAQHQPTGTLTVRPRTIGTAGTPQGGESVPDAAMKINGGAPGASATFAGFSGVVQIQVALDPLDRANYLVSFIVGRTLPVAP